MTDRQRLALLRTAEKELKLTTQGHVQWVDQGRQGGHWKRALAAIDKLERDLAEPVPILGPIQRGGKSLLSYSLTHKTTGIPFHPAVDANWGVGTVALAPEPLTVIAPYTSANPGAAFYALGKSQIQYWVGHLTSSPRIGTRFATGQEVGRAVAIAGDDDEHVHWALNVERIFGPGKQLLYGITGHGPDYTHGAPTVGTQLKAFYAT